MSENNNRNLQNTEYLSVTFEEIKQKLLERAETYYPDTYRDFNKSSFGSLMFDLVAMVGEQLNFYAQFVANEGFVEYARTGIGLTSHARRAGISLGNTAPRGYLTVQLPMVVSSDQSTPDSTGGYTILKGAIITGPSNATAVTEEDIILKPAIDPDDLSITTEFNPDGSRSLVYYKEVSVPAIVGEIKSFVVDVGKYTQFLSIEIPDRTCTDIISVVDSEGNRYYQVENLAINTIQIEVRYTNADTGELMEQTIDLPVPRRFAVKEEGDAKFIEFGYGSEDTLKIINKPVSSADLFASKQSGRGTISTEFVAGKYFENDRYGVAPSNTTLTILYRSNSSDNSSIAVGELNTVQSAEVVFDNPVGFGETNMNFIRNNVSCTNNEPFNGVVRWQSTKEIAIACAAAQGAQARAVTESDIRAQCYLLPPHLGKIKKASVYRDSMGLRKMLNVFVVSEDENQKLELASQYMKENLKKHLDKVKMVTDSMFLLFLITFVLFLQK